MKSQLLLSFLLCLFSFSAIAQERPQTITIKGTITGAQPPVYLFCETQIHTLELSGDRFQMEVSVPQLRYLCKAGNRKKSSHQLAKPLGSAWLCRDLFQNR